MKSADLERLLAKALGELDLASLVADALPASLVGDAPVRIVAIGKGAPAMARGAIARWGGAVERCLVVAPDGTDTADVRREAERARIARRVEIMHAAHPLPDARSVRAAEACLALVATEERRSIVALVSGGASSLVCAPSAGITLRTKRAITRAMLESGAAIHDINVVRKHLSRIKGGGLARAAGQNDVITIVASDVIGGTAADVGSGPSIPDVGGRSTEGPGAARRLLRRFAPSFADVPLARPSAGEAARAHERRARARIVTSPEELALVFARLLRVRGIDVRLLPPSQASAEVLAKEYAALARRGLRAGGRERAFVRAAEPSIVVPPRARGEGRRHGGRSTHVAALVGRSLSNVHEAHDVREGRVLFGALASDGVDGGSGCGGAIIDDRCAEKVAHRLGPDALDRAISRFDTGSLHRAMGSAVPSRPTGHNLADIHVLIVR